MPPTPRATKPDEAPTLDPKRGLVTKLAEVMDAMGRVPKTGYNSFHRYAYATEGDISEGLRHELGIRNVALTVAVEKWERLDHPATSNGRAQWLWFVYMTFVLTDGDTGESHKIVHWPGVGIDGDDKGLYKAMTGAQKYWMMKTFMVATGDDPEQPNDNERGSGGGQRASQPAGNPGGQRSSGPATDNQKKMLHAKMKEAGGDHATLKRIVIAASNGACRSIDDLAKHNVDTIVEWIDAYRTDMAACESAISQREEEHPDWFGIDPKPQPTRNPPGSPAADDDDIPF